MCSSIKFLFFFFLLDIGFIKVDATTKSGDIELKTVGDHNIVTSKLFGSVDVKYKVADSGKTDFLFLFVHLVC